MMDTLDQVATRSIFVHPNSDPANLWPTHRLLADLGHDVTSTSTLEEALRLMGEDPVDLLILEEPANSDASYRDEELQKIRSLPMSQQPHEIAIFSDRPGDHRAARKSGSPHVHVLVKPLHMHGLLQVLRRLESRVSAATV
jgi:CheY-like chemotaxis protein